MSLSLSIISENLTTKSNTSPPTPLGIRFKNTLPTDLATVIPISSIANRALNIVDSFSAVSVEGFNFAVKSVKADIMSYSFLAVNGGNMSLKAVFPILTTLINAENEFETASIIFLRPPKSTTPLTKSLRAFAEPSIISDSASFADVHILPASSKSPRIYSHV